MLSLRPKISDEKLQVRLNALPDFAELASVDEKKWFVNLLKEKKLI